MRRAALFGFAVLTATMCCASPKALLRPAPEPTPPASVSVVPASFPEVPKPKPIKPKALVSMSGDIDEKGVETVIETFNKLEPLVDTIVFEIHTSGGDVGAGFKLAKRIEQFHGAVICVIDGDGVSEGFYILQSCDMRLMTRRSRLMVHEPYYPKAEVLNSMRLIDLLKAQQVLVFSWTEHVAKKMKLTAPQLRAKLKAGDWWMTCDDALAAGAVDGLVDSTRAVWRDVSADRAPATLP